MHLFRIWPSQTSTQFVQQGDTVEIVVDCVHSKIILKNLRTHQEDELGVSQWQIPLPWQIEITLDRHGDRIRIL